MKMFHWLRRPLKDYQVSKTEPMEQSRWDSETKTRFQRCFERVLRPQLGKNTSGERAKADCDIGCEISEWQNFEGRRFWYSDSA